MAKFLEACKLDKHLLGVLHRFSITTVNCQTVIQIITQVPTDLGSSLFYAFQTSLSDLKIL